MLEKGLMQIESLCTNLTQVHHLAATLNIILYVLLNMICNNSGTFLCELHERTMDSATAGFLYCCQGCRFAVHYSRGNHYHIPR